MILSLNGICRHGTGKLRVLTKGDNNDVHDRGLYNRGQKWLNEEDLVGRVKGYSNFCYSILIVLSFRYTPYLGMVTIILNDYPQAKLLVIIALAILVITNREN